MYEIQTLWLDESQLLPKINIRFVSINPSTTLSASKVFT